MSIVRVRLGKRDQLIKVWYKTMRDRGDSISMATVFIIRYYIKTGQYLDAACLKAENADLPDDIKGILVPEQSDVGVWLAEKTAEGMKKSALIKRILRSSIRYETAEEQPFLLDTDKLFQYSEHPEVVPAKQQAAASMISKEPVLERKTDDVQLEPPLQTTVQNIAQPQNYESGHGRESTNDVEAARPVESKPKQRSNTLFNNLVTTGLKH